MKVTTQLMTQLAAQLMTEAARCRAATRKNTTGTALGLGMLTISLLLGGCAGSSGMSGSSGSSGMSGSSGSGYNDSGRSGGTAATSGASGTSGSMGSSGGTSGSMGGMQSMRGVVQSIEPMTRQQAGMNVTGAMGAAAAGGAMPGSGAPGDRVYRVTLRAEDGSSQSVIVQAAPDYGVGDRVMYSNGSISRQ